MYPYKCIKFLWLFVIFWLLSFLSFSQNSSSTKNKIDSLYIQSYRHRFIPSVGLLSRNQEIDIRHKQLGIINFRANVQNSVRFGATYKGVGLHLALAPKLLNRSTITESSFFNLRANLFGRKFSLLFNMLDTKGFYISNPQELFTSWQGRYPELPSMHTKEYKITAFYSFNHRRYSFRHFNNFNELQIKSAGSFVLGLASRYYDVNIEEGSVLDTLTGSFRFRGLRSWDLGPSTGYAHNFVVFKKVYATAFVFTGPLVYSSRALKLGSSAPISRVGWNAYININLGRNTDRVFYGVSMVGERKILKLDEGDTLTGLGTLWLFFGYRFGD